MSAGNGDRPLSYWLGRQMRQWKDENEPGNITNYTWDVEVLDYEASLRVNMNALKDALQPVPAVAMSGNAQRRARLRYLLSDLIKNGATKKCSTRSSSSIPITKATAGRESDKLTGTGTSAAQVTTDYYTAYTALCGFKDDKGEAMQATDFRPLVWIPNNATFVQVFEALQLRCCSRTARTSWRTASTW